MIKRIYSYLIVFIVLATVACSDDEVGITNFGITIDLSASSLSDYQLVTTLLYSTDGGDTFEAFPKLKIGQTFQAKVIYNPDADNLVIPDEGSMAEIPICPFQIDWSASKPAPVSVDEATGIATFVVRDNTAIAATVTNIPFDAAEAAGTYEVVTDDWNDFSVGAQLTVEKIDNTHIRVVEYPATSVNHAPLVITITNLSTGIAAVETQDNGAYSNPASDEEVTVGSGVVSSCAGTIDLTLKFTLPCCGSYSGNVLSLQKVN